MSDTQLIEIMTKYFRCMDTADFDTSAALFSDDAVYIRPPYVPGEGAFDSSGTTSMEGLEAIRAFWRARGKRNTRHVLQTQGVTGREWFAEGEVTVDDTETRMFLSHVTFDEDNRITRFVALR